MYIHMFRGIVSRSKQLTMENFAEMMLRLNLKMIAYNLCAMQNSKWIRSRKAWKIVSELLSLFVAPVPCVAQILIS